MATMQIIRAMTFGIFLIACEKEQLSSSIVNDSTTVDFNYQLVGDCSTPTLEVVFENKTLNAKSYLWDFGDGTITNQENPTKVYAKSGNYSTKLTAYFAEDTLQVEKLIGIGRNSDGTGPSGKIALTNINATNRELTFEITTDAPAYLLDFGDGTTRVSSNEQVVTHRYAAYGTYYVFMLIQNNDGCNCVGTKVDLMP